MHPVELAADAVHAYRAFGLGIRSALPLPELQPCAAAADVTVRFGRLGAAPAQPAAGQLGCWAKPGEFLLCDAGIATCLVRDGREVILEPRPGVEPSRLRLFIMGWVMSAILYQRGLLLLHGSAVAVHGSVAAFLGGRGIGKSTLASALYARGHRFVADDLLAIAAAPEGAAVYAAFPHSKLSADAIRSLGGIPNEAARYHPASVKRAWPVGRDFPDERLPLAAVFVLSDGDDERIVPLRVHAGVWELVRHAYALRLVDASGATAAHLRQCTEVARRARICRLLRRRSLTRLDDTARLVEQELTRSA